jgi:glutathione S-transferase
MTLYLKAAEDGQSVGDCPFAHYVRMILEEKGLEYQVKPTPPDGKPMWLVEYYDGKMPALRHRKECYVESQVIAEYLEYFFPQPSLSGGNMNESGIDPTTSSSAMAVLEGFFPTVANFLKDINHDDDDNNTETTILLKAKLRQFEDHLSNLPTDSFLCGPSFSMLDCRVVPQLYHLQVGIDGFKHGQPNLTQDYPQLYAYMQRCFARPSFQASQYPTETILWGWNNARQKK